jgi:Uma2 family endonuclease
VYNTLILCQIKFILTRILFPGIADSRELLCHHGTVKNPIEEGMSMTAYLTSAPPHADQVQLLTGDEVFAMGDIGRSELINGRLIVMSPASYSHGIVENNFGAKLGNFAKHQQFGQVLTGDIGIYITRNPDTIHAADVAYISNERFAQVQSKSYLDVAPELIVEVLSPDDAWSDVMDKLADYFAIGVQAVWIADPKRAQIFAYRSLTDVQLFTQEQEISGGTILPGFNAAVAGFFYKPD